jgi:3-oxoadipate enol-lactonase
MSEIIVDRGGFSLAADVTGQPEGAPWLILSNSLGASRMMWEPQLALLGTRYRVLRYDTRGHGASDTPHGTYTLAKLGDDVIALMDHFRIGKASFMGLSLGGMTGLGLAINHGSRFERIICCDARADAPPAFVGGWDERKAAVQKGGLQSIVSETMRRWFVERWRETNKDHLARFEHVFIATTVEGYQACASALRSLDYLKDLGSVRVPMLYVVGEKDVGAPPAVMQAMAQATPGAEFAIIPDAAHLPNIDNTPAFNAAISGFLGL